MLKIILASHNPGKLAELTSSFNAAGMPIEFIPQASLGISDIAETATTFVENALIKARHATKQSGLPALADDSGLVVPALNGAPGIYSARYAGEKSTAAANITKLLTALQDKPLTERRAFFHCTLVYLRYADDPMPIICEGTWHGEIALSANGEKGFGYDPIFYDPVLKSSAALLSSAEKNRSSHRGQALRLLLTHLRKENLWMR
jgi:XTP/dITP diphosphohydrolase